ncbi:riboflavin kinase [Neopestalotiopsis sp. 37M]|nr:riboflavin kinase [Neopestalotiopsis sp. 37M]
MLYPDSSVADVGPGGRVQHLRSLTVDSLQDSTLAQEFDFMNYLPGLTLPHESATDEDQEDDNVQETETSDTRTRRIQKLDTAREHLKIWESFSGYHAAEWLTTDQNRNSHSGDSCESEQNSASTVAVHLNDPWWTKEYTDEDGHKSHARAKPSQYSIFPKAPTSTLCPPSTRSAGNTQSCGRPSDLPVLDVPLRRLNARTRSYPNIASNLSPTTEEVRRVSAPKITAKLLEEIWDKPRTAPAPPLPTPPVSPPATPVSPRRLPQSLTPSRSALDLRRRSREQRSSLPPPPPHLPPPPPVLPPTPPRTSKSSETVAPPPPPLPSSQEKSDHITSVFESDSETENGDRHNVFQNRMRKLRTKMGRRKSHYEEGENKKDRNSYGVEEDTVPVLKLTDASDVVVETLTPKRKRKSVDLEDLWYKGKQRITSIIVSYKRLSS